MRTGFWKAVVLVILCTIFTTLGQILYKYSASSFSFTLQGTLGNTWLLAGLASYGLGAFLLLLALKYGNLSLVYPFVSLTFIWVVVSSFFFFGEIITIGKGIGVAFIILGTILVGRGGRQ